MDRTIEKGKSTLKFLAGFYILFELYTLIYISYWFEINSMMTPIIHAIGRVMILVTILSLISVGKKWARIVYVIIVLFALYSLVLNALQSNIRLYDVLSLIVVLLNLMLITNKNVTAYMERVEQ